jgi:hypothetical protein
MVKEKAVEETKENLYSAVYHGSGTFTISKPKRKPGKRRQSRLKKPQRMARK